MRSTAFTVSAVAVIFCFVNCEEPCKVPSVPNGELGKYEEEYLGYMWRAVYAKVPDGATLDGNQEVVLQCDQDYMPRAQPLREITITCLNGKLSPQPECVSTYCLGDPPPILGGRAVVRSRRPGYVIWYMCNPGFEKRKTGNITCLHGSWTGNTPVCGDTRCDKESLNYPGLVVTEGFIFSGRSFEPTCHPGYQVTEKSDRKIFCNRGEWTGNLEPCIPEPNCSVGSVYDVIPEGVVPHIDDSVPESVPYGYVLRLACDEVGRTAMSLKGSKTASCSAEGKWTIESYVKCVQGCGGVRKQNGSELLINPDKDFYNIGESIIFSCPEGKLLTKEIERIMCFRSGWMPDVIPHCQ